MKVLIDDKKTHLPDGSIPDVILRNYEVAWNFIVEWGPWAWDKMEIYLDHDLGTDKTGYDLVKLFEIRYEGAKGNFTALNGELPAKIVCVSNNGAGRRRIEQVVQKLYGRIFHA